MLTIFDKSSASCVWQSSEYVSVASAEYAYVAFRNSQNNLVYEFAPSPDITKKLRINFFRITLQCLKKFYKNFESSVIFPSHCIDGRKYNSETILVSVENLGKGLEKNWFKNQSL